MRLAEKIKDALTVNEVLQHYGFKTTNNKMPCPFHREKQASFVVRTDKSWRCYGCGSGGTVIDFVMKLYNINFGQALIRINNDFSLGLTDEKPSASEIKDKRQEYFERRKEEKAAHELYIRLCEKRREKLKSITAFYGVDFLKYENIAGYFYEEKGDLEYIDYLLTIYDEKGEAEFWKLCKALQKNSS